MTEIVEKSTHGIDLHTGALHRNNLPQIRANLDDEKTAQLAKAFGVPVLLNAKARDGSLRDAVADSGTPILVYEAGEALRFNEVAIRAGLKGVLNVLRELGMLRKKTIRSKASKALFVARSSSWERASSSGLFRKVCSLGARVKRGEVLGLVDDPFSGGSFEILASSTGIIIGCSELPLVHEGDALFHIARFTDEKVVAGQVETFQSELDPEEDRIGVQEASEPPIV
jgi:predicted deacylase